MFSLNSPHIDDVFWIETEGLSKPDVVEFPLSQGPFFFRGKRFWIQARHYKDDSVFEDERD